MGSGLPTNMCSFGRWQRDRYDNFLHVNREEEWDRLGKGLDLTEEERETKDEEQNKMRNDKEEVTSCRTKESRKKTYCSRIDMRINQ